MIIKDIYMNEGIKELVDFSLIVVFTNEFFKKDTKVIFHFCMNDEGMLNIKKTFFSGQEDIINIWDNLNKEDQEQTMEDLSIGLDAYFNNNAFLWPFRKNEVLIIENSKYRFVFLDTEK